MNRPHKIIFVLSGCTITGGGQVSLLELIARLDRSAFMVQAVVGGEGELQQRLEALGIAVSVVSFKPVRIIAFLSVIDSIRKLGLILKTFKPDLIHSNDTRAHVYCGIAGLLHRIAVIFHFRVSYRDGWYDRVLPLLCTQLIAVSRACAGRFKSRKTLVIYNGVDIDRFTPAQKSSPRNSGALHIGTIGRLEKAKGIDTFVACLAALRKELPALHATIIGSGKADQIETVKNQIRQLGCDDYVTIIDKSDNIPAFMQSLDVYALFSDNEGLNRSILEAMACGVSVVATRVGGNPEVIVDDTMGRLVPYDDQQAAIDALRELLRNGSLRKSIGQAARKRIEDAFSIKKHVEEMGKVFLSVIR